MQILDQQLLLAARDLMQDKFKLMVEYFVEDTEGYISEIDVGFVECDYIKKLKWRLHTIKSSSGQLGAVALKELGKELEAAAISEERSIIEKTLPRLKAIFAETKEMLASA